jgi:hypothetical protein
MKDKLHIREVLPGDASLINAYWADATDADLMRMGELQRPSAEGNIEFLNWLCAVRPAPQEAEEAMAIWMLNDTAVGYASLKAIRYGVEGQIHLHMCLREERGKGRGAVFFCLSALHFMETFHLKDLYCQPKADNPMPNGMLRRLGFPEVSRIQYPRKDGSVIEQVRYRIAPETARAFLVAQGES